MTNQQLYLSIGIPSFLIALAWFINFLQMRGVDKRIERVEDKADRHYESLNAKIDRQTESFNNQVTTLLTTIHNVDTRVVKLEEKGK